MEGFEKIKGKNLAEWEKEETGSMTETSVEEESRIDENNLEAGTQEQTVAVDPSEEAPQVKNAMDEPVGRHYIIDSDITVSEIRSFMLGHTYRQPSTWIIMLIALVVPAVYIYQNSANLPMAILVAAIVFVVYPTTIVLKARGQKKTNPTFQQIFHYMLDEVGCHLQLADQAIDVEWRYFNRMMLTGNILVIYTGKNNGYIIPLKDMGDKKDEIIAFLKEKINK